MVNRCPSCHFAKRKNKFTGDIAIDLYSVSVYNGISWEQEA